MRNPMNSWSNSDTTFIDKDVFIGPNDLNLMKKLIHAGSEHRKFLRQIMISVDITAPLYWWKEFDTYKVGTVANSCSTMHKLTAYPITTESFEMDDATDQEVEHMKALSAVLEQWRVEYLRDPTKANWKKIVRFLPESWLQKRTVTLNYENILTICNQRMNHKLNEWSGKDDPRQENFIAWAKRLPYAQELLFTKEEEVNEPDAAGSQV